jgi:hypothetical protein
MSEKACTNLLYFEPFGAAGLQLTFRGNFLFYCSSGFDFRGICRDPVLHTHKLAQESTSGVGLSAYC